MSLPINREVVHTGATDTVVPVNRWSIPNFGLQVETGTWLIEGTLARVNRGETPVWETLFGIPQSTGTGVALSAVTADLYAIDDVPVEAIRLTSTGAATARLFQSGLTDW